MWNIQKLKKINMFFFIPILGLMIISLIIISSHTQTPNPQSINIFWTALTIKQGVMFLLGFALFFLFTIFDYNRLRELSLPLYLLMIISLVGLFFMPSIQGVHRWYKIPIINFTIQPSEYAKLIAVFTLSWFLERRDTDKNKLSTLLKAGTLILIPFFLIVKQPDLGTGLVLLPITLIMFYFANIKPRLIQMSLLIAMVGLLIIGLIFSGSISHESLRPYATLLLKEYQFDRLDPNNHHHRAAANAIAIGGITGKGWGNNDYTTGGFLPAPYTDSPLPSLAEEFGLIGIMIMLGLHYYLIFLGFRVCLHAKNSFGRLLAAGISILIAAHVLINCSMMCGFLPITGVPLTLVSYGGSSILATMMALGILQSIYVSRFRF